VTPFRKLVSCMIKPWVVSLFLISNIFFFFYLDKVLACYFTTLNLQDKMSFLNWFTHLGLNLIYLIGFAIAALFFRYINVNRCWEVRCWFLWFCVSFTGILCVVIKVILGRARPIMWFESNYYGFYGLQADSTFWSFPSGHTTTVMAVAFGLCVIFPRYCYTFIILSVLIACTRVLLVHHYLTDILVAGYLSLLEISLLVWVSEKKGWFNEILDDSLLIPNQITSKTKVTK
jgi:membrane-associated phospholipid phosphatase